MKQLRPSFSIGFFLFFLITRFSFSSAQLYMTTCSSLNYTAGSTYSVNLNELISSLIKSSSSLLYANASSSSSSSSSSNSSNGEAYGMFQCRGDLKADECFSCVNATMDTGLRQKCPFNKGANIQQDSCHVQYDDNPNFFNGSIADTAADTFTLCSTEQNTDRTFQNDVQSALQNVSSSAALMENYYAATREGLVYALAQCDGYLTPSQCTDCLSPLLTFQAQCNQSKGGRSFYGRCSGRFEDYLFFVPLTPLPPLPASPSSSPSKGAIAGGTIAVLLFGAICVGALLFYLHRRRNMLAGDEFSPCLPPATVFSYEELKTATRCFHQDNKLGEGGFGPVYKGVLLDGREVAIKKLAPGSHQGKREFMNEVSIITSVQHRNLIKLYGCCVKGSERLLVYEYLPNKSLDLFLFDSEEESTSSSNVIGLDWLTRFEIIHGIARGLSYLHQDSQVRIIHRDIKPSNILLDTELAPKIADFGLARLFSHEANLVTTTVAGTLGYLSPEYAMHGHLTEKNDVFSFGVVTLEIVSGRKNADFRQPEDRQRLLDWAWKCYRENEELQLLDVKLRGNIDMGEEEEVTRVIHVALLCTQSSPSDRPSMSKVLQLLSGQSERLETPTMPFLAGSSSPPSDGTFTSTNTTTGYSYRTSLPASEPSSCTSQIIAR